MSADRVKPIIIGCLYLSLMLDVLGCTPLNKVTDGISLEPERRLRITIDESQREELFEQFRKFSDKHSFEILIREAGPNGEGFFVEIMRSDVYINATITRVDPKIVSMGFFNKQPDSTSSETVNDLVRDLKNFISEIPNVTITEE